MSDRLAPRRVDLASLEDRLGVALELALMGDGWSRSLQSRLETVTRQELDALGLRRAQVRVSGDRGGVAVEVRLPTAGPRVQTLCIRFGSA